MSQLIFGYRPKPPEFEAPPCPCGADYVCAETDGGLHLRLRCWCGLVSEGSFDTEAERDEILTRYEVPG